MSELMCGYCKHAKVSKYLLPCCDCDGRNRHEHIGPIATTEWRVDEMPKDGTTFLAWAYGVPLLVWHSRRYKSLRCVGGNGDENIDSSDIVAWAKINPFMEDNA